MFSIPLNQYRVPEWELRKQKILDSIDLSTFKSSNNSPYTDYHYLANTDTRPSYYDSVIEAIAPALQDIQKDYPIPVTITKMWMQSASKGQYHPPHTHGSVGLSGVLYLDFNKASHTATTFFAPYHNFITGDHIEFTPEVTEGDLLIFPSGIMHMQPVNDSYLTRKIISFNIAAP